MKNKVLVIRMSSFGDIVQCMSILEPLTQEPLHAEVHWVARSDLSDIPGLSEKVSKVWSFDRKGGLVSLIKLGLELRKTGYTHIYDAHSSMRSRILCTLLRPFGIGPNLVRRSKERLKRILLFSFRINKFPKPFRGMISYYEPLKKWGLPSKVSFIEQWQFKQFRKYEGVVLAPSAAWEMKRWPIEHWKELIHLMDNQKFLVLGGPGDNFCQELEDFAPERVRNLAGNTLVESCYIVANAKLVISGDTGLIHVADLLGVNGLSLMGPTAFGFKTNKNIKTLEVELSCRPCTKDGRGACSREVYKECLVNITPARVASEALSLLN